MKISTLPSPFSFLLDTSFGKITINEKGENISVFLQEQKKDEEKIFHWPGEYEMGGVAVFIQDINAQNFIGKVFVEHIRVVFFTDENIQNTEDLNIKESIGNTDVLIFKKGENGLTETQVKKLIEEIDPQVLVANGTETKEVFKKMGLPVIAKETLSFTKKSLPQEHTEYYSL